MKFSIALSTAEQLVRHNDESIMWLFKKKKQLKDVKTEIGNSILKGLVKDDWVISSEYSPQMFDKGVDFDSYTLCRDNDKLEFEWDNWMEWTITGPESLIDEFAEKYQLKDPD